MYCLKMQSLHDNDNFSFNCVQHRLDDCIKRLQQVRNEYGNLPIIYTSKHENKYVAVKYSDDCLYWIHHGILFIGDVDDAHTSYLDLQSGNQVGDIIITK